MVECILPEKLDELFIGIEQSGHTMSDLVTKMSDQQRMKLLDKYIGTEKAQMVNDFLVDTYVRPALEEQLKGEEGLSKKQISDLVLNRVRRMKGEISEQIENLYFDNAVADIMKFNIDEKDAVALSQAQQTVDARLEDLQDSLGEKDYFDMWSTEELNNLTDEQKQLKLKLGLAIRKYQKLYKEIYEKNVLKTATGKFGRIVGSTRAFVLSADTSFLRQLSNMFFVNTKAASKGWWEGQKTFWREFIKGDQADAEGLTKADYVWAEIYSHPNVLNGTAKRLGINITITEEPFVGSVLGTKTAEQVASKVPLGSLTLRAFSASENAFDLSVALARFTAMNSLIDVYQNDIKAMQNAKIGEQINEVTGRWVPKTQKGKQRLTPALSETISLYVMAFRWTASRIATAKNIIYAPAMFSKSLTGKYFNKANAMRGQAAVGQVIIMSMLGALGSAAFDDDKDKDFFQKFWDKWTDFEGDYGKLVIGKTRFDVTFGVASIIQTAARAIKKAINPSYSQKWYDPIMRFLTYRQSPLVSAGVSGVSQLRAVFDDSYMPKDVVGNPQTFSSYLRSIFLPIFVDSAIEYGFDEDPEVGTLEAASAVVADWFGVSATTYSKAGKLQVLEEWGKRSPLAQISKRSNLYAKLSPEEFAKAEEEMETIYMDEATKLANSNYFKNMTTEQKDAELKKLHRKVTDRLSKKYVVTAKSKKK